YPDPLQYALKNKLSAIKNVSAENIFIGNGSDEVIDLAIRIFCNPQKDNVIICPPTYGMYEVSANINDVAIKKINLTKNFQLDAEQILNAVDDNTKLLFLCSPNNPTGNSMNANDIEFLLKNFRGIVIIDEAYINYSKQNSFVQKLKVFPNLIVMQTLSKAWGLAALRLGLCFAVSDIISLFNKVKPPYNINQSSQKLAIEALRNMQQINSWAEEIISQKVFLEKEFEKFSFIQKIYPSDANFLLLKVDNANDLYKYLSGNKIIIRNRSKDVLCDNCVRITVGTPVENILLLEALKKYKA
ncbi:MAG: histidinol-phosphate transaminase, partial [Bacteroidota bacterium]|nr:histidinol-phosphate transaminase [Bacteroidota bacterium]